MSATPKSKRSPDLHRISNQPQNGYESSNYRICNKNMYQYTSIYNEPLCEMGCLEVFVLMMSRSSLQIVFFILILALIIVSICWKMSAPKNNAAVNSKTENRIYFIDWLRFNVFSAVENSLVWGDLDLEIAVC